MAQKAQSGRGAAKGGLWLLVGVVGIVGGLGLLAYGLAPAKDLWEAVGPTFSGGQPPEDLSERLDAAMADLKGRAVIDAFGSLALMAGVVLVSQAFKKPASKPVEQLVHEEVERRLAAQMPAVHGAQSTLPIPSGSAARMSSASDQVFALAPPTSAPPTPSGPPPAPRPAAAPRRTHCASCGSVLVAAGRICPQGHAQA